MRSFFSRSVFALGAAVSYTMADASDADCRQFYEAVDQAIAQNHVRDSQEALVKGYPYLRSSRFTSSLVREANNDEQIDALLQLMMDNDRRARQAELNNLPAKSSAMLEQRQQNLFPDQPNILAALNGCANRLRDTDRIHWDAIKPRIHSPQRYSLLKRLFGFYPFTAIPFSRGIRKFQADMTQTYAEELSQVVSENSVGFYVPQPLEAIDVEAILRDASNNPLKIPQPSPAQLAQLFNYFAPNFAIENRGDFDRPGAVNWNDRDQIGIDPAAVTIYTLASHTKFDGQNLLQLNYMIWFSERPKKASFDMLGGKLDGLIWRVTLAADGKPLLYDSIHPCGCYHLFFPTEKLRAKPAHASLQEHAYIPQAAPRLGSGERSTIWIQSATHYLVRVTNDVPQSATPYTFADYDQLRSLPKGDGTKRSMFRPDGLIEGTERGERVLFWPMGIASPGAMRQWGHHATAFVGMRHFDDSDLIDKAFEGVK
jgi:hypothetical protein